MRLWLKWKTRLFVREYFDFVAGYLKKAPGPQRAPVKVSGRPLKRILFVCDNMWERRELLPELQNLSEVTFLEVKPGLVQEDIGFSLDPRWFQAQLKQPTRQFDAAVVYLNGALLSEEILALAREQVDGPFLGLNLDDKTSYTTYEAFPSHKVAQNYRRWAPFFDSNLTNSRTHVDIYRADGFACEYLPTGFHYNPAIHQFNPNEEFVFDLSFLGSCKPERKLFVDELRARGIEVKLFGGGWEGASFSDEGSRIFRQTQINLGFGYNVTGKQITNLKNRDFECPGSGGCYLTTYDWELANLFEVGKEILCYRDIDDFIEIYLHFRNRPQQCREIAKVGFKRAIHEHTWAHRFQKVFKTFGLTCPIKHPPKYSR